MTAVTLALVALVILVLSAVGSFKFRPLGFLGALIAILIGLGTCPLYYGIFIFAIALVNLLSLTALQDIIKGVDYSLVGLMALATMYIFTTHDFAMVLVALVLVSVPTYILVMLRAGKANIEVGIKYITFMVLATVMFLIGAVILLYAHAHAPGAAADGFGFIYAVGYVMLVLGLSLEVGVAPLHEWVPDVFTAGDPIPISIIASLAKVVPFVAALWILIPTSNAITPSLVLFTAVLAAISMFTGNIGALTAREPARVLAYSTVANMGYVLSSFVVIANREYAYFAIAGSLLMLFANAAGKIGFFNAIKGEGAYSPFMYILAFSFIGVPPLMGFWGKLYILFSIAKMEYFWLVAIMVINSAISIPYYIRLAGELGVSWRMNLVNFICLIAVIITLITALFVPVDWFFKNIALVANSVGVMI